TVAAPAPGAHVLPLGDGERDPVLVIPRGHRPDRAAPLLVALAGAGRNAESMQRMLGEAAQRAGAVLLAPQSVRGTWDGLDGAFGADVARLDAALAATFARVAVDTARVWVAGFSDGATYALSLALANGDLFPRALVFSPGFVVPAARVGRPVVFVSHGTADRVLTVERTRRIVADLRAAGYRVRLQEFEGGHELPAAVLDSAMASLRRR
ncbi:dienelactone hydrolase family protein, partial [Roseisolibacter sp. H3M3-2]|uniref:alpha/beta hydrolase n=1 Tax=Roseisolibacter sp. H3M3-2 TaxID=3031323 RepID=UPI0023DB76C3